MGFLIYTVCNPPTTFITCAVMSLNFSNHDAVVATICAAIGGTVNIAAGVVKNVSIGTRFLQYCEEGTALQYLNFEGIGVEQGAIYGEKI